MRQLRTIMAISLGVYPLITGLQYILAPILAGLPIWQRTLVFTPLMVTAMTHFVVPTSMRLFAKFING